MRAGIKNRESEEVENVHSLVSECVLNPNLKCTLISNS